MDKNLKYPLLPATKEDWRKCPVCRNDHWAEIFLSRYSPNGTFINWHGERARLCLECRNMFYNQYPAMEQVIEVSRAREDLTNGL